MDQLAKKTKGGWPKGKRRNQDSGKWSRTLIAVKSLVEQHWTRGLISRQALAIAVNVDPRTVARWLNSTDRPSVEIQAVVVQWVKDRRKSLKAVVK
jgi:DNA invertase Pin-like site-specific DNA recombinase